MKAQQQLSIFGKLLESESKMSQANIQERIDADLKEAMRARDEVRKLALRAAKTAITQARKEADASATLSDDELVEVIARVAKQRRDAVAEYEKAGREDLAGQERAELAVLEAYLPAQLSEAELEALVREVVAETGATSLQEMGKIMPLALARAEGRADGRAINQMVRRVLG